MYNNSKSTKFVFLILRLFKIAFSILTLTISAKYFGVSIDMDVWIIVSTVIATLTLSLWGPLNETFRAKFVFIREYEGEASALFKVRSLLLFVIIITIFVSLIVPLFSESIAIYLAPSLENSQRKLFISILIMMTPSFLLNELINLGTSILNSYNIFYIPEIMAIISGIINLLCIVFFSQRIGIKSLIIAHYISCILLIFLIIIYIKKTGIQVFSGGMSLKWEFVKPFIYFSIPFFIPYFFAQFNNVLEKNLANSLGVGTVSIINYASQFKGIIQSVFTSVLASIMVPNLSKQFANLNNKKFEEIFNENLKFVLIVLTFLIPTIFAGASQLSNIFYNHGSINSDSINTIIYLVRFYSISILSVMLYLFFGFTLLSQQLGKKYAFYGSLAQIISIIINIFFYKITGPSIFPISLLLSHFVVSFFMFLHIISSKKSEILKYITKIIMFILIFSTLGYYVSIITERLTTNSYIQLMIIVSIILSLCLIFSKYIGVNLKSITFLIKQKLLSKN